MTEVPVVNEEIVTVNMNPSYNFEKFLIEKEHPQANCPFMGYNFMPHEDLFEDNDSRSFNDRSNWGQWEEWGRCNSYSGRQIRLRPCIGDRYRCSSKDTYQSRGIIIY